MSIPETDLSIFISRHGSDLVTDTRAVAIAFGKQHKNVLQTVDRMMRNAHSEIAQHARLNFQPCTYAASNGKHEPMYRMTAKGLSELAMSFAGDQSRVIRIRFLNAFEAVADRLAATERSITERLHALTRREAPSELKGRVGSLLMNERKREKPQLAAERAVLEQLSQPSLLNR